jgi:hypothetical protein
MARREGVQAERVLRDLMIARDDAELRLLLAEIYLEGFATSHEKLIEAELRRASKARLTEDQQHRMQDLRARLARIRRGPL